MTIGSGSAESAKCCARPAWDPRSDTLAFAWAGGGILHFQVSAEVSGTVLAPTAWTALPGGGAQAKVDGFAIEIRLKPTVGHEGGLAVVASIVNASASTATFGWLRLSATADSMAALGTDLRIYKEGWSMTTPAGSVRPGDNDFFLNPDYRPFATSVPKTYDDQTPNVFAADYAVVLNDQASGSNVLVGFISSEAHVSRFSLRLQSQGLSAFDAICEGDGIAFAPGVRVQAEELVVLHGPDGYALLETFADLWAARMKAVTWGHTPTGWCSWPYYFERISEADMLENATWLSTRTADFPLEYVQMDDGYQAALGDWLICDPKKFPHGLQFLAQQIASAGFKPGIWLAPFLVEERSQLYAAHPEWVVRDANGQPVWVMPNWRGSRVAALDCTRPEACAWLTGVFSTLSRFGYAYVKLDFLAHLAGAQTLGGVYADPTATRVQAIRRGLRAIRAGLGDDKLILTCTSMLGAGVGIANACRIGTDFLPAWNWSNEPFKEAPTLPNVLRNVINRRYMHGRLWLNDPDAHIARIDSNKLTGDEVRMFTAALWLTGGMILTGDRFSTLAEERGALSKMILADLDAFTDVRPLDVFTEEYPSLLFGRSRKHPGRIAIGAFNYGESAKVLRIDLAAMGIPAGTGMQAIELWSGSDRGVIREGFQVELQPHSSQVFVLSPSGIA